MEHVFGDLFLLKLQIEKGEMKTNVSSSHSLEKTFNLCQEIEGDINGLKWLELL